MNTQVNFLSHHFLAHKGQSPVPLYERPGEEDKLRFLRCEEWERTYMLQRHSSTTAITCSQEHVSTTTPTQLLEQDAPTATVAPPLYYICTYLPPVRDHLQDTSPTWDLHMLPALYHTVIYRNCSGWRITPPYSKCQCSLLPNPC